MAHEEVKNDISLGRRIIGDPEADYRLGISEIGMPGSPKIIRMFESRDALCEYVRNAGLKPGQCFNLMKLDLSGGDLSGADLSRAVMTGSEFRGTVFDGATFESTSMRMGDFTGASFKGCRFDNPDMSHADFTDADFTGATLKNSIGKGITALRAKFNDARLRVCVFVDSVIDGADFTGADISRIFLDTTSAAMTRFTGARVSQYVSVTNTNLSGAKVPHDLRGKFKGAALSAPGMGPGDLRRVRHSKGAKHGI